MRRRIVFAITTILLLLVVFTLTACQKADETAPVFNGVTNGEYTSMQVNLKDSTVDFMNGVTATDETDGEVTPVMNKGSYDNTKTGTYTITYTATDAAGNIATATRTVTVVDTVAPLFTYATNDVLPAAEHLQYAEFDLSSGDYLAVRDNYDTNLTATVKDNGGYDKDVAGAYTITYTVKDSSNNETTATRIVTVKTAIKYIIDVLKVGEDQYPVISNSTTALTDDGSGLKLRGVEELQFMTKEFYVQQVTDNASQFATNGNIPYLPYGVAVVLDKDYNPVLVRNATYAIEAIKNADGTWQLNKNGEIINDDGSKTTLKTTFIDGSAPAATGVGILGGNFVSYIPDGGFVVLAGSPKGGANDLGKIFLISHFLDSSFGGGALAWEGVATYANGLLTSAKVSYEAQQTTLYEKPADMAAPVLTMEKHVLSWEAVTGAKSYELYIDGELKTTTTSTSIKMIDLGLTPSEGEDKYEITVKALSSDIRYYGDSALSTVLEYKQPNAVTLTASVVTIENGVVSWAAVEGASGYTVYAQQVGEAIELGKVGSDVLTFNANNDSQLAQLTFNAFIYVKATGDDVEYLESAISNKVTYMCSTEEIIQFGDDNRVPVIVTTAADYFARRNDSTEVGYASKPYIFMITDPENITSTMNEAYGFLVVIGSDGTVKSMINIVNTTQQLINGVWKTAADASYTGNNAQIAPLAGTFVEGDTLLIGRSAGTIKFTVEETEQNIVGRAILAHYFWGNITITDGKVVEAWRAEHALTTYPTYVVKPASQTALANPVLTISGTVVSWAAVENATSYDIYFDDATEAKFSSSDLTFDLMDYVAMIGKSGSASLNTTDVKIKVVAKGDGKDPSKGAVKTYTLTSELKVGEKALKVNYNVENALWNGGSGANCRLSDAISTFMTGKAYKSAFETYAVGTNYTKNAFCPFMQNGIIIKFDKDMKITAIRFGYVTICEIAADGTVKTTDLTWNNSAQATPAVQNGNFKNLETEVTDDGFVLIVTNAGSKVQLTATIEMFIDSANAAAIIAKTATVNATSATFLNPTNTTTTFVVTAVEKAE